jgi:hypothetical protein
MPRNTASLNERALAAMGLGGVARSRLDGRGIAIAFVDYGFDLLHPALIARDGKRSRFAALWCQGGRRIELDRAGIGRMIAEARSSDRRDAADAIYDPHGYYYGRHGVVGGAHGTVMASIAAGTEQAGFRGVAPGADILGVHLALPDHAWKEEDAVGRPTWIGAELPSDRLWEGWRSYDASASIVDGLDHAYEQAAARGYPGVVVNLSIGTWAGAHDGRSAVEAAIGRLVDKGRSGRSPAVAVVVGTGNAGANEGHFSGTVTRRTPSRFHWFISAGDPTQSKLEIWYDAGAPLDIALAPPPPAGEGPRGDSLTIVPGATQRLKIGGRTIGIADHAFKVRGRLSRARILVHPPLLAPARARNTPGRLAFEITTSAPHCAGARDRPAEVHAWIERDDGLIERSTLAPSTPLGTLCAFACAPGAIVVAGYDHNGTAPADFPPSSRGPLPWNAGLPVAPLVCAPAHRIWGALSKTADYAPTSGTSAAAALVSGLVALMMQRARAREERICVDAIAEALAADARPLAAGDERNGRWNARHGFGVARLPQTYERSTHDRARPSRAAHDPRPAGPQG